VNNNSELGWKLIFPARLNYATDLWEIWFWREYKLNWTDYSDYSYQKCARDLLSRDRDETRDPCLRNRYETETFKILYETRPSRDVAASETLAETLKLPRLSKVSWASMSRRDVFCDVWWNTLAMKKKLYGLINSHHGNRFLFVILWVFALYFDNYHWIINGLHHKKLQLQCCRHEPLFIAICKQLKSVN